jgi:hypothetical protein
VLDVQREGPVVAEHQIVAVTDGIAIEHVVDEPVLGVVHRDRPERSHRWQGSLCEANDVRVCAVQRLAVGVGRGVRVHHVLTQVGSEPDERDERSLQVVCPEAPHVAR